MCKRKLILTELILGSHIHLCIYIHVLHKERKKTFLYQLKKTLMHSHICSNNKRKCFFTPCHTNTRFLDARDVCYQNSMVWDCFDVKKSRVELVELCTALCRHLLMGHGMFCCIDRNFPLLAVSMGKHYLESFYCNCLEVL